MKAFRFVVLMLSLVGCVSSPTRKYSLVGPRADLFPTGTYHHAVDIELPDGKEFGFDGIVSLSPTRIKVVGLGALGSTLFTVEESRATGKVSVQIYQAQFKPMEERLRAFYAILRRTLMVKVNSPRDLEITDENSKAVRIQFSKPDANEIPSQISIQHPAYRVRVTVVGYEV